MNRGKVYLVGAGPGDPELLTLRAHRLLQSADVILYDGLVGRGVLEMVNPGIRMISVGKHNRFHGRNSISQNDIQDLMIQEANAGNTVIRLQGGDPGIFGRLGEEMLALADAKIPFEVVPGVSSVSAASALSGIPLTLRNVSSGITIITGHENPEKQHSALNWQSIADNINSGGTLVILMGVSRLRKNVHRLLRTGLGGHTPVAVVERASVSGEFTLTGTLDTIVRQVSDAGVESPAIIIIGDVIRVRKWSGKFLSKKSPETAGGFSRDTTYRKKATG